MSLLLSSSCAKNISFSRMTEIHSDEGKFTFSSSLFRFFIYCKYDVVDHVKTTHYFFFNKVTKTFWGF